jgi:uncharacterized protein YjaZ
MSKKGVDMNIKKFYANETMKWCKKMFGPNERKRTKLIFEFSNRPRTMKKHIVYGNYCFWRNKITLYLPNCDTIHDIVSTIIHEYTHYLQSRTKYLNYQDNYYYSANPYEREAKRNEEKYTKMCISYIKSYL